MKLSILMNDEITCAKYTNSGTTIAVGTKKGIFIIL